MVRTMEETTDTQALITYALWGTGTLDPRNAEALLSQYVPDLDSIGFIYRPDRIPRENKGLRTAVDWFEAMVKAQGLNCGTTPSQDLLASLLDARDTEGDKIVLIALWPEAPTREDFAYIRSFEAAGILVVDLSRALDDLDLSLYTEPDAPKEPKVKAEPKKRGAKKLSDVPEDADIITTVDASGMVIAETVSTETLDQRLRDLTPASVIHERNMNDPEYALAYAEQPPESLDAEVVDLYQGLAEVIGVDAARAIDDFINAKIRLALVHRTEPGGGLSIATQVGFAMEYIKDNYQDPPFDGPYIDEDTSPYYTDRNKNIRPAEGKPRRGEIVINLGPLELEVAKKEGRYNG
jgi:hypothetical protein